MICNRVAFWLWLAKWWILGGYFKNWKERAIWTWREAAEEAKVAKAARRMPGRALIFQWILAKVNMTHQLLLRHLSTFSGGSATADYLDFAGLTDKQNNVWEWPDCLLSTKDSMNEAEYKVWRKIKLTVFENHLKSLILEIASEASYVYFLNQHIWIFTPKMTFFLVLLVIFEIFEFSRQKSSKLYF